MFKPDMPQHCLSSYANVTPILYIFPFVFVLLMHTTCANKYNTGGFCQIFQWFLLSLLDLFLYSVVCVCVNVWQLFGLCCLACIYHKNTCSVFVWMLDSWSVHHDTRRSQHICATLLSRQVHPVAHPTPTTTASAHWRYDKCQLVHFRQDTQALLRDLL